MRPRPTRRSLPLAYYKLRALLSDRSKAVTKGHVKKTYAQEPIWNCETAQWAMMTPRTGSIGEIKLWARA